MPRGPPGHRKQEKASWVRELIYVTDGGATRKTGPAKCNRQRSRWIQMRVLISTQGFFLWNRQDSQQARGVLRTTVLATWRAPYQCLYRHSLVNGPQWRILRFELQSDVRKRPSKTPLNVATTPRAGYKRKKKSTAVSWACWVVADWFHAGTRGDASLRWLRGRVHSYRKKKRLFPLGQPPARVEQRDILSTVKVFVNGSDSLIIRSGSRSWLLLFAYRQCINFHYQVWPVTTGCSCPRSPPRPIDSMSSI